MTGGPLESVAVQTSRVVAEMHGELTVVLPQADAANMVVLTRLYRCFPKAATLDMMPRPRPV